MSEFSVQNVMTEARVKDRSGTIVGESQAMVQALENVRRAARTDSTVLIQGESGTGKELVARMLHDSGNRADGPFVGVHCAELSESLMESELFGHEKGAFTGAERSKPGRFELAEGGTLFFDEVSEMSMATQVKLLRVLQEREYRRVGGTSLIKADVRIVGASAFDLSEEVRQGRFREDLYYRFNVVPIRLPPLRERKGDVLLLIDHYFDRLRRQIKVESGGFDDESLRLLYSYCWPGNVRELKNVVERMLVLYGHLPVIGAACLPDHIRGVEAAYPLPGAGAEQERFSLSEAVDEFERELISRALEECDGIQTRAAEKLGTTRRILKYRMEKLNITLP